jgi:cyclic beta-1,2-glucan synthetase
LALFRWSTAAHEGLELPAAMRRMLDARAGRLLPPLRSEVFGPQRFAQHGRSLGLTHAARLPHWAAASFFPRLRANVVVLRQAQQLLQAQAAAGAGASLSPASQWLLDNFHLIDAQLLAIHEGLPRSFFRALPVLQAEPLAGLPRIYGLAWAFVAHTDSAFDEELLLQLLSAYQETRELQLGEMWALPTTLRVVLVENLRRLAERLATYKAARELANRCCDAIDQGRRPDLQHILDGLVQRGADQVFLAQLGLRLQDRASGASERVPDEVSQWLLTVLPNLAAAQAQQGVEQTADNLSVSNAVASLRAIGDADWQHIVARASPLMRRMLGAPLFAAEHHGTQDDSLHGIERLARRSGRSEMEVAEALLALMQPFGAAGDVRATAGHWLQGAGRPALRAALGQGRAWHAPWLHVRQQLVLPLYLVTLALATMMVVAGLLGGGSDPPVVAGPVWPGPGLSWWGGAGVAGATGALGAWPWLAMLLLAWPASEAVIALMHRVIAESTRPQRLPRLALASGIPPDHRVLVVIPAMLSDGAAIAALAHRLELHHLANPQDQAQFGLLTDWTDADSADGQRDQALFDEAVQHIQALNLTYPAPVPRFLLLHRRRRFSSSERRWIGWERKRGKLEQLVALLAEPPAVADGSQEGAGPAFVDLGPLSTPRAGTRYVVTLDSDTQLPPDRLRDLVGVAAHPAHQPVLSADGRRVVSGYGILQPRLVTPLPQPREDTYFHRMFAGQGGIDPYSAASSEVHQDLYAEGSFSGKGLLHVQAVHAVLGGRLPMDQVLSHDLLEGALARCAAVTDISFIEDAPFHAEVAESRMHRWTRGDWQLLPILLRSVLQPGRYPLGAANRWKMADNLRRSLVAPVSLLLLLLVLAGDAVGPLQGALPALGPTLVLVLAAFSAGPLMGALAGLVASRPAVARLHFYRGGALDLLRAAGGGLWHLLMLLQHALLAVDAIVRALWRMLISQRRLLQWTTAAAAQAGASGSLPAALRRHWSLPLVASLLGAGLWAVGTSQPLASGLLCLAWGAAPLWTWLVSRTGFAREPRRCTPADAAYLNDLARDTWRYFERTVTAADHHLPPDNLQTQPQEALARRTSPTNIGLYLLAACCAQRFGWLGTPELLQRLHATLATLDGLQRHRGHFLNWYDTATAQPLLPLYVSTVDSGNLSGHLLAVAQACLELARQPDQTPHAEALRHLARRCQTLAWAPDFAFLYHARRHLLHIGLRVAEQQLDGSFYDLLASESRLASLLAIAKGDVPVRHWAALGRPFFAVHAVAGLQSWSGSMFEYLMPTLVLAEPHGSVLHQACQAALLAQRAYAGARHVPWGISESAYAGRDHTLAYQYAPQGVPRLALRRTPADELVVAPYATALAAQLAPALARSNFDALQALGARGPMGFIESLDYTPARQLAGERMTPVLTVMAHHAGMSLVALSNVLLDGVAQRWGMADPHIEAVASLLHERAPREVSRLANRNAQPVQAPREAAPTLQRRVPPGQHAVAPTHMLSNGRYSVTLRANGAGRSRWGASDLTRWRDDALRDLHGSFLWLRRDAGGALVSLSQHPAPDPVAHYQASFHADRVVLLAEWADLQVRTTVWVSPEDDIEFRRVELLNLGSLPLSLEVLSSFEPTLAEARADEAHPAFGNLFISVHADQVQRALWLERRPRLATEDGLHAVHFLAESGPGLQGLRCQASRQRWLGRNRAAWAPLAELQELPAPAPGADLPALDTGLDPMCVLAARLLIAPGARAHLCFATAAAGRRDTLVAVVDKYREPSHIERAALMSTTLTSIRLHALQMDAETYTTLQSLTTALMMNLARPLAAPAGPPLAAAPIAIETEGRLCDKRLLFRFGLSGDRPLLLVSVSALPGLGLVRSLSQALSLWAWGGVPCDLVVVNAEPASYEMALQRELGALRDRHDADRAARVGPALTGWHLLRADDLSAAETSTLQQLARLRLQADGRSLAHHLHQWARLHEQALQTRSDVAHSVPAHAALQAEEAVVTTGDFAPATPHTAPEPATGSPAVPFVFRVGSALRPQRPWVNVMANQGFGTQVSEAGGGCTWAINSRLNQLTPWSNDPVADPPSEWLWLQDLRSRQVWSLAPSALAAPAVLYRVQHGQGHTRISHHLGELELQLDWCVDAVTAVKQVHLRVVNHGQQRRRLRCVSVCEWLLGAQRSDRASVHTAVGRLKTSNAAALGAPVLLATQLEHSGGFGGGTAFHCLVAAESAPGSPPGSAHAPAIDWTCDRREFFDARGRPVLPDHLGQQQGGGLDPCAALSLPLDLAAGEALECTLMLGWAPSAAQALHVAQVASQVAAPARQQAALDTWDRLLGATQVATPDPLFDALVNRWLLYQAVSCRLWGKAGFYQAGGATGFRDQLQDAMALSWAAPDMLRAQLLRCASRQFPEGDVQHWWHETADPMQGAGVRTHFSDDLLWLPFALAHYLQRTADTSVLDEQLPFLDSLPIPEGAEDLYATAMPGAQQSSVYEHAARTLDHSLRVGVHGLPLMGAGDWNDGMNRVGHEGRGESVWLAWFLCRVVADFAPVAQGRGEHERAQRWEAAARGWQLALAGPAWDGHWYRRAFFDDGQVLGSADNGEARIDLIAQAWSVLAPGAPPERQAQALAAVQTELLDADAGLLRLLHPPLVHAQPSAGYIQAYPPGVRENGGQYSHAGVWALMAQVAFAQTQPDPAPGLDRAWQSFEGLSPAHRSAHAHRGPAYGVEPYVIAGDVYSATPWVGRGGWSWYTGAAAWLYRAAIESLFGLDCDAGPQGQRLRFVPGLPSHWPRAAISLRRDGRVFNFLLLRATPDEALARAAPWGAGHAVQLLLPGHWLTLAEQGAVTHHVVPWGMAHPAHPAQAVPERHATA